MRAHRSVSQLLSYSRCSEEYRLSRVAKVPQSPAAWAFGGNAVHTGIEAWENSGRTLTEEEVTNIVVTEYRGYANNLLGKFHLDQFLTGGRKDPEKDLNDREDKAVIQALDYMEWARPQDHLWTVEKSELAFTLTFGNTPVRGYIDQVIRWGDGTLSVRDLKSGNSLPGSPIQLAVYAIAVEEAYGVKVTQGEFLKLKNPAARSAAASTVQTFMYDLEQEPSAQKEFLDDFFTTLDQGIENEVYLPNPDESCERVCSVSQWCRAVGGKASANEASKGVYPFGTPD